MTKLSEIKDVPKKVLILGRPGTGKTYLIGTLCQILPTLLVTSDIEGLDTLRAMKVDTEVIHISDWNKIWDYYYEIAKLSKDFAALAIDDFKAMQETSSDRIELQPRHAGEEKAMDKDRSKFQSGVKEQIMLGDRRLQIQQWGDLYLAVSTFLSEVMKLPFRVKVVTATEAIRKNPRDGQEHLYPAVQGQIVYDLSARFSMVAETFIHDDGGNNLYCLSCKSHGRLETKSRFDENGGRTWVNPTAQKILKYMAGQDEAETAQEKKIGIGL